MIRKLLALSLLLAVALSSCSATLRVRCTAPTDDNDGTCTVPSVLHLPAGAPRVVHFAWTGAVSGEDSIATTGGALVTFTRTVPPGTYVVRGWASDAGGAGCDTSITVTVKAAPWRVSFQ